MERGRVHVLKIEYAIRTENTYHYYLKTAYISTAVRIRVDDIVFKFHFTRKKSIEVIANCFRESDRNIQQIIRNPPALETVFNEFAQSVVGNGS